MSAKMSKPMTEERMSKIMKDRRRGFIIREDLEDDYLWIIQNQKQPTDIVMGFHHANKQFCMMNKAEITESVKTWKKMGLICWDRTVKEVEISGEKKWVFSIQDPKWTDETAPMCPLFCLTGIMSSGFTYITTKNVADWVVLCLKKNTDEALAKGWGKDEDEDEDDGECEECGVVRNADELTECKDGVFCSICADEIDQKSGKRRREM
jgi:hypothetical protein